MPGGVGVGGATLTGIYGGGGASNPPPITMPTVGIPSGSNGSQGGTFSNSGWTPSAGSYGAAGQAAALAPPVPVNTNVQQDPNIAKVQGEYQDYINGLDSRSNQNNINSLQNQRDLISGMSQEAGNNAAERGFSAGTGVNAGQTQQAINAGMASLGQLNAQNTASAQAAKGAALSGAAGLATAGAANTIAQQNYALNQSKYQQDTLNFQAQLQAMQNQNAFNNSLGLLNAENNFYSGF